MWSYPPSRIVVAVDLGEASRAAVRVAGALAAAYGAELAALHAEALEAPAYFTHEQIDLIEREQGLARRVAESHLSEFVRPLVGGPFSVRVIEASPASAIVEAARAADLVVMGTHGRRGPSRWWLGSVAERVVRECPTPVLVVRETSGDPAAAFSRPLLVAAQQAFDGDARRYAEGLASTFQGGVADRAATCEADLAAERRASLIVVPTRGGGGRWFGESAERLLRGCSLPMLFVPAQA